MGAPVRIADLARRMIHLSGLEVKDAHRPHGDIEIRYSGLRPGEKLYEELLIGDHALATDHERIMRAQESLLSEAELQGLMSRLKTACDQLDADSAFALMKIVVREFNGSEHSQDWVALRNR
jgi:FlaA1/EpsC-like NDP-sugar epimerase